VAGVSACCVHGVAEEPSDFIGRWDSRGLLAVCHSLNYTSVQKHDARLDRLLKMPDREIVRLVTQDENMTWKLPAIVRATFVLAGFANIDLTVFFPKR
jgi:hypothetical protein